MTPSIVNIVTVEQLGAFLLRLHFDDGTEQVVDFEPFLSTARHPDLRYWFDPVRFAAFRLESGELIWGDYELCFPIGDLYRNQLLPQSSLESVA